MISNPPISVGIVLVYAFLLMHAIAHESKSYTDAQGRSVLFPLGDISFADEVVSFAIGDPMPQSEPARRVGNMLGEPTNSSLSLGCSGEVVVRFTDNSLVDINGPDLYIFEIGKEVEATQLAISQNGEDWIDIGPIDGSTAEVDIAEFVPENSSFEYVRLTDRNIKCKAGNYSGADIDAVGAIGAAVRFTLSGSVLFEFDSAELRQDAFSSLDEIAAAISELNVASVIVEGHTDSMGTDAYNLTLSQARARAVAVYFEGLNPNSDFVEQGFGESRPIADNANDEGRAKNRRVEIIVIPGD